MPTLMPRKKTLRLCLMGGPGSGKGTVGPLLEKELGIPRLSTGDIIRDEVKKKSVFGRHAKQAMESGGLISDPMVVELVAKVLKSPTFANGVIFDGFPRSFAQAYLLEKKKIQPSVAVLLTAPDNILVERLSSRRVCPFCHAVYNLKTNPPKVKNKCDFDRYAIILRKDDSPEVIRKRLEVNHIHLKGLADFYKDRGTLVKVDATGNPRSVLKRILKVLPWGILQKPIKPG